MKPTNIFITTGFLCIYSPDSPDLFVYRELTPQQNSLDELADIFNEAQIPGGMAVNFIVDQQYVNFHYQSFPLLSRRKIDNMLAFELEDWLIEEVDAYHLSYYAHRNRDSASTELCIYSIQKSFIDGLQRICSDHNLDIKRVYSFNNFLDLRFKEAIDPLNYIFVSVDRQVTRIFIYENGVLKDNSTLLHGESSTEQSSDANGEFTVEEINQKIDAIRLSNGGQYQVAVESPFLSEIQLIQSDRLDKDSLGKKGDIFDPHRLKELVKPSILNHPSQVNFSESEVLIYQELKKHFRGFAVAAVFLIICLLMYGSYIGLGIYNQAARLSSLELQYEKTVTQYLPKGASKSNAIAILKDQVEKLSQNRLLNRKYASREYFITHVLSELSSLKTSVPSLNLKRFSYNKKVMRFQGTVTNIADVELLREKLEALFPKESHSIKLNQRSTGNESVELSTSIHFK